MNTQTIERIVAANAAEDLIEAGDVRLTREEVLDVDLFLASERGAAWLKRRTDGAYYTQWYDYNRSPHETKWCNELADEILDMKRDGACRGEIIDHVESKFSGGQSAEEVYAEEHEHDVARSVGEIAEALDELREDDPTVPVLDVEAWTDALRERITQHMYDEDDSGVMDLFGRYDRCELIVDLGGDCIQSTRSWADFDHLVVDEALQKALYAMGYTVTDYRRMTGNRDPGQGLRRGLRRRPQPLLTEKELRELVGETTSTNWRFVLYALVPVGDLVDIDLTAPISLGAYSIAAYNSGSGTFYDIARRQAVTIMPGEGVLRGPGRYSPKDICCMDARYAHADISNVEA